MSLEQLEPSIMIIPKMYFSGHFVETDILWRNMVDISDVMGLFSIYLSWGSC